MTLELDKPIHFFKSLKKKGEGKKPRKDRRTKARTRLMKGLECQVSRHGWLDDMKVKKDAQREKEYVLEDGHRGAWG